MEIFKIVAIGWGLFWGGTFLVWGFLALGLHFDRTAEAYRQVNAQCTASRPVYTAPIKAIPHARPVKIASPVRPEPARIPAPAPVAEKRLRLRPITPEESQRSFLVENWPLRKPVEQIERN